MYQACDGFCFYNILLVSSNFCSPLAGFMCLCRYLISSLCSTILQLQSQHYQGSSGSVHIFYNSNLFSTIIQVELFTFQGVSSHECFLQSQADLCCCQLPSVNPGAEGFIKSSSGCFHFDLRCFLRLPSGSNVRADIKFLFFPETYNPNSTPISNSNRQCVSR